MPLEFQSALPPHVFGIPVQETPPLPRNSKMPPVVWYGYFLESPILVDIFFDAYAHLKMFKPLELFGILHIQLWAKS